MNIYSELCNAFLKDLQAGLFYRKKVSEEQWEEKYVGYSEILKAYCRNTVPRNVFLKQYQKLPPIESTPNEEKIEWRKFVNETFPGTTPEFRLDAIKIIYTIGNLTN